MAATIDASLALEEALLRLDRAAAASILRGAGGLGELERVLCASLERIGANWERGSASLSQVYMSGRICEELMDALLPASDPLRKDQPRLAVAVLEDQHALGKRIVYACLRAAGYSVADFGQGVAVEDLVARVRAERIEVLLVSALMLPSALRTKELVRRLRQEALPTRVLVGGAPFLFDAQLWREGGADAMGRTALDAVSLVRQFSEVAP